MGINLPNCQVTVGSLFTNRQIFRKSDAQLNLLYTNIMLVLAI
jgi:hypothetical protein